ncbi:hypothetical protein BDP27DRAFT_1201134, partial [Rhodocollybia butyracea]
FQGFIVIDVLDECMNVSDQERLLSLILQEAEACHLPFKFLIVSRSEPEFWKLFNQYSAFVDQNEIGPSTESNEDIQVFLRLEFSKIRNRPIYRQAMEGTEPHWPGDDIISGFVEKACGQFIYATTVMKYVD